jgi:hypothetical protein
MQNRRLWIGLGVGLVVLVAIPIVFVSFFFMSNEPSPTRGSTLSVLAAIQADQTFIGTPFPAGSVFVGRRNERGFLDEFVVVSFSAPESAALAYATSVLEKAPTPGYSMDDDSASFWKSRPAIGRGGEAQPTAARPRARKLLLSDPDANGITTVWVMAFSL